MKRQNIWGLAILLLYGIQAGAQVFTLKGTVFNARLEPIPFVEVRVKELKRGTTTDANGLFEIKLPNGRYEVVFQSPGYKSYISISIINEKDEEKQIILEEDTRSIREVTISDKYKDPSKEIIRKLIANKNELQRAVPSFSFKAYIKAYEMNDEEWKKKEKEKRKKNRRKKEDSSANKEAPPESHAQFAEVYLTVSREYPDKFKEERTAINIKGNKADFFYLSSTEGDFNFYDNLLNIKALGPVSFLSPFSLSGLISYRYEYLGLEIINNQAVHHIKFRPSKISNVLIEGEVWIRDEIWAIEKIEARFPEHQTPEFKHFEIIAEYEKVQNKIWLPTQYEFTYQKSESRANGTTLVKFSDYNVDTAFDKKYFNTELSFTTDSAYHRDSTFWNNTRPVPLTSDELKVIRYKDSIYEYTHSEHYQDSVDKKNNKITFWKIVYFGPEYRNWRKEKQISFPSLLSLFRPIEIGGPRVEAFIQYEKIFKDKRKLRLFPNLSYGFQNQDIRGNIRGYYLYDPFRRSSFSFATGRSVSNLFWQDAIVNLVQRTGYFLKDRVGLTHRTELLNGLYIENMFEFGVRRSMHDYRFSNYWDSIFYRNQEVLPIDFPTYNASFYQLEVDYTPFQMYLREPREKVILGSKYPTLYAKWRKGIRGLFGSVVNYDYIEAGLRQELNMGTLGIMNYNLLYGNFLNEERIEAADYKRIARGNPYLMFNPMNSFQNMDSTFSLFQGFGEGHMRHEFNGALINKIPYAKKLKIFESAGSSILFAPERDLFYIEAWVGLEKQIRLFRQQMRLGVYGVSSYANQFQQPFQIKFGIRTYDPYSNTWN